jgi:hypothetical protein
VAQHEGQPRQPFFGFMATDSIKRADGVRELREVDVFEISIVPAPANPDTRFLR